MKLPIPLLLALPQAVLGTVAQLTMYGVPNCPSSYSPSSADWTVFGASGGNNPVVMFEGQCTLSAYTNDGAGYYKGTCTGNGNIILESYVDSTCTTLSNDGVSTQSDGVCTNRPEYGGSMMFSCLVPTSAPTSAPDSESLGSDGAKARSVAFCLLFGVVAYLGVVF